MSSNESIPDIRKIDYFSHYGSNVILCFLNDFSTKGFDLASTTRLLNMSLIVFDSALLEFIITMNIIPVPT